MAVPVFAGKTLKAVLVVLCANDATRIDAIDVRAESDGILTLADGCYGAATHFEWVTASTRSSRAARACPTGSDPPRRRS